MIHIKTQQEIEIMQKSADILVEVKQIIWDAIKPGVSTYELDQIAEREFKKRGAKPAFKGYQGFPATACISVNDTLIHGIPSKEEVLKEGDVISVDMGGIYQGYYSDSAFTKGVGQISKKDKKLIKIAEDAFWAGVNAIKPGARVGDIEEAIGKFIHSKGYYTPELFTGHGIGKNLHEDPAVHNLPMQGDGPLLKDGMIICIEPMILQGSKHTMTLRDGWTIKSSSGKNASHYEHMVLIKDGYPVIMTEGI